MATPTKTTARSLLQKIWGSNWIEAIPVGWRDSVKMDVTKTPGVPNGSDPDAITGDVVASQVTTNRTNELEKETTELDAVLSDKIWHEQDYDERFGVAIPKQRYLTEDNAEVGLAQRNIRNFNSKVSEVERFDLDAIEAVLSGFLLSYVGTTNVELPDVLESITSVIEHTVGDGNYSESGDAELTGNGSVSLSLRATAQASATVIPEAWPGIRQFWGNNIKCTHYHFFLKSPVTETQVLNRLNALLDPATISAWPKFNPEMVNIKLTGQQASTQTTATSQGSISLSGTGNSSSASGGTGYSKEKALTVKTLRVSPTIHGILTVSGDTSLDQTIGAHADADAAGVGPSESIDESADVSASVSPTIIPATPGATEWPTSGKFLRNIDPEPYKHNYIQFHCVVIDAADFPNN